MHTYTYIYLHTYIIQKHICIPNVCFISWSVVFVGGGEYMFAGSLGSNEWILAAADVVTIDVLASISD